MKTDLPIVRAMPFYLVVQGTLMISIFLEFPVYMLAQRAGYTLVTPWVVLWLILTAAGLVFGISALVRPAWKMSLETPVRLKMAGGYLLGALAGLVALGVRFMPLMPPGYFYLVGGLTLALALAFIVIRSRSARQEELFP